MRTMDSFRGLRAPPNVTNNMPIHDAYTHYLITIYQPGCPGTRTRLCTYIHAACNKCGFKKKKKKK
jgi:hypothetical protein